MSQNRQDKFADPWYYCAIYYLLSWCGKIPRTVTFGGVTLLDMYP